MKLSEKALDWFARWFASAPGVWQTAIALAGWIVLEYAHVVHDDNMFQLMAWLTIYSGLTQPVLAYVGTLANRKLDRLLEHLMGSGDADLAEDRGQTAMLRALTAEVAALHAEITAMRGERP